MKIKEIIEVLKLMPQDKKVKFVWDGAPHSEIECIYISNSGDIIAAPLDEEVSDYEDRPIGAPPFNSQECWSFRDFFCPGSKAEKDEDE